jgi:ParB-like chromosome segregation protein Spo0J
MEADVEDGPISLNIDQIDYRKDLYPRFEPDQSQIRSYAKALDNLPPIEVNQDNILIDGYHRWKAHALEDETQVAATVTHTESEKEVKRLAYRRNSHHGMQLSNEEKKTFAQEMVGRMDTDKLASILSVTERTIQNWTSRQRKALRRKKKRKAFQLYLRAWHTQQSVADLINEEFGEEHGKGWVSKLIEKLSERKLSDFQQSYDPPLYNIWNQQKKGDQSEHFGGFPKRFMRNLLHYHTEPKDVVFDPFAGSGMTVDVCEEMARRYYCSDFQVEPGREEKIRQHDITEGLPDDLSRPQLAFLDPPYWKQAEGRYSEKESDLGNMSLDEFNEAMTDLLADLKRKRTERIAVVIQPTQYANDFDYTDHVFDFAPVLGGTYDIEMRYILPYATEQYNAQQVEKTKEVNTPLVLHRDLVVWKRS